jgi:hypothetical protein
VLGLDTATRELLRDLLREFHFAMNDGAIKISRGFRVEHNHARDFGQRNGRHSDRKSQK